MAWVTLSHDQTFGAELPAFREWTHPALSEAGVARVFIPNTHPAFSADYINTGGGSRLGIQGQADSGVWNGRVTGLRFTEAGVEVTAHQDWLLLSKMASPASLTIRSATPDQILTAAIEATGFAIAGIAPCPPSIETYQFSGAPVWSVITEMMDLTGLEVYVDTDGLVEWGRGGAFTDNQFVAGYDMLSVSYALDILNRLSMVTATNGTDSFLAQNSASAASNWPASLVVQQSDATYEELADIAVAELAARKSRNIQITGKVRSDHWSIQERDYLKLLIPGANFAGVNVLCRVLRRSIDEASEYMTLGMQEVDEHEQGGIHRRVQGTSTTHIIRQLQASTRRADSH